VAELRLSRNSQLIRWGAVCSERTHRALLCFDARLYPICPRINPKNWSFWHSPGTEARVILFVSSRIKGITGSKD
jgi:hypothetical protein